MQIFNLAVRSKKLAWLFMYVCDFCMLDAKTLDIRTDQSLKLVTKTIVSW